MISKLLVLVLVPLVFVSAFTVQSDVSHVNNQGTQNYQSELNVTDYNWPFVNGPDAPYPIDTYALQLNMHPTKGKEFRARMGLTFR